MVILLFGTVTVAVSLMLGIRLQSDDFRAADSLVESLFPAFWYSAFIASGQRKAAITSISVGAIIICLTFFVWDLGFMW